MQISPEIRGLVGDEMISNLSQEFKQDGAKCPVCEQAVRPSEPASLVAISGWDDPPLPALLGIAHLRCSESVVLPRTVPTPDEVAALWDKFTDIVFWPLLRTKATPRAALVVEHKALYGGEPGVAAELTALALASFLEGGFSIATPPVVDLDLDIATGFRLERDGTSLVIRALDLEGLAEENEDVAFEGQINAPKQWWDALAEEQACGFFMGINLGLERALEQGHEASLTQLDLVAKRGDLVAGAVRAVS
jgi:hypothetical protein